MSPKICLLLEEKRSRLYISLHYCEFQLSVSEICTLSTGRKTLKSMICTIAKKMLLFGVFFDNTEGRMGHMQLHFCFYYITEMSGGTNNVVI